MTRRTQLEALLHCSHDLLLASLTQSQPPVTRTTHTLPFDKLAPRGLERLCLWLVKREGYERAEHLGAAGSEQGRDIVAFLANSIRACFAVGYFFLSGFQAIAKHIPHPDPLRFLIAQTS